MSVVLFFNMLLVQTQLKFCYAGHFLENLVNHVYILTYVKAIYAGTARIYKTQEVAACQNNMEFEFLPVRT